MDEQRKIRRTKATIMIIVGVITLCCIAFGVLRHFTTFFQGEGVAIRKDEPLGQVKSVDVAMGMGDLEIKKGTESSISISCSDDRYQPTYTLSSDGSLHVVQNGARGVFLFGAPSLNIKVVITLADDLEDLSVELDMGKANIEGITAKDVDIDLDMGDLEVNDVTFTHASCDLDMGKAKLDNIAFEDMSVSCDMGAANITVAGYLEDYSITAKADMGSVSIDGKRSGNSYKTTGGKYVLEVDCNMGSVKID